MKSYGCLKFLGQVWIRRACAGTNEKELTACAQKRGLEFEKRDGSVQKKGLVLRLVGDRWSSDAWVVQPLVRVPESAGDQRSPAGCSIVSNRLRHY
jgi:hypothetical protein